MSYSRKVSWLLVGCLVISGSAPALAQMEKEVELYHWVDFDFNAPAAASGMDKWDVEGSCTWTHESGSEQRTSLVWYSGSSDRLRIILAIEGAWEVGWFHRTW